MTNITLNLVYSGASEFVLYESVDIFTGMLSIIITLLVNLLIETSGKNTTNIGFHSGSWKIFHTGLKRFKMY